MKLSVLIAGLTALSLSACANTTGTYDSAAEPSGKISPAPKLGSARAAPAPTSAAVRTTARGAFVGDTGHVTTGTAEVFRDAEGWKIRLGPDFSLDGAPDPKVALGNGGYVPGTILGKLSSLKGEQVYALKPGLDIGDYNQVYIWCERFDVPLGHADLTLI